MRDRARRPLGTVIWLAGLLVFVGLNAAFMVAVVLNPRTDASNRAVGILIGAPLLLWVVFLFFGLIRTVLGPWITARRWHRFEMQLRSAGLKDADDETVAALLDLPVQIFGAKMLDPKRGGGVDHVMAGRFDDREVRCCNVRIRGRMWIDAACVAIEVPTGCPPTIIAATRAAVVPLPGEAAVRSELERFNRRFWVSSADRYFASALLDARMIERLLEMDLGGLAIELAEGWLVIWDGTPRGRRSPDPSRLLELGASFVDRIPVVMTSLYPRSGAIRAGRT